MTMKGKKFQNLNFITFVKPFWELRQIQTTLLFGYASIPIIHSLLRDIIYYLIISRDNFATSFCVINLCLRFISRFRRFYDNFTLPFTLSLSLSLSSIPFTSLPPSLYLSFYLSFSLSPSLSLLLSLFSLSFSMAYPMDVVVLVYT